MSTKIQFTIRKILALLTSLSSLLGIKLSFWEVEVIIAFVAQVVLVEEVAFVEVASEMEDISADLHTGVFRLLYVLRVVGFLALAKVLYETIYFFFVFLTFLISS